MTRRGVPAWRSAAIDAVKKLSADVGIPATLNQVKELFRKIMA